MRGGVGKGSFFWVKGRVDLLDGDSGRIILQGDKLSPLVSVSIRTISSSGMLLSLNMMNVFF